MLPLRIFALLALGFWLNPIMATEMTAETVIADHKEQPLMLAEKLGSRRRGDCGLSPGLWTINVCENSNFCYVPSEKVSLWLPQNKRSGRRVDILVIKNLLSQQEVEIRWPATKESLPWPVTRMPVSSGTTYLIKLKNGGYTQQITLHQLPAQLSTAQQLNKMQEKSCQSQVKQMLEQQQT